MRRQIIFDTDPSPDDAVAFLAALASPEDFEVLAITTVAGNVPVALTSKNARKALELAKRTDVPVYAGASAPLVRPLVTAEHVHGRTGFDGFDLPEPHMPLQPGFAPEARPSLFTQMTGAFRRRTTGVAAPMQAPAPAEVRGICPLGYRLISSWPGSSGPFRGLSPLRIDDAVVGVANCSRGVKCRFCSRRARSRRCTAEGCAGRG